MATTKEIIEEKDTGVLRYIANFFMNSATLKKKAGRSELVVGILIYMILTSAISILLKDPLAHGIAIFIISIPYFTLCCRRYNDVGFSYKMCLKLLAIAMAGALASLIVTIVAPLTPFGKEFYAQSESNISAYINLSNYTDQMLPSIVASVVFFVLTAAAFVIQMFILFSKTDKFKTNKLFNAELVLTALSTVMMVVFVSSIYYSTFNSFNMAKNDFVSNGFEIDSEDILDGDIIIQSGVFTPGVEADDIESIKSYYDKDMKSALEGQYDYYASGRYQIGEGVYICPVFSQNVKNGDNVSGLIELCVVNTNDSKKNISVSEISIAGNKSSLDKKYEVDPGLTFIHLETSALSGGESFQAVVNGFNVITSLTNIEDMVDSTGDTASEEVETAPTS